jgi:two-component system heavy metal sensor histidine kinase CusS
VHEQLEELTRLSQIIEELLFLSRAESREIQLGLATHDPEVLLANFTQDARVLAEHSGVHFKCTHRGHGIVQVEPRWLRRVLLNLLTNALHASPPNGTVVLDSAVSEREWRVSLSDQGPGVAPENLQRIFERFFRVAAADGAEGEGSGLGLAICKSIIGLHGGEIWAEAAPYGTGLQLVFRLPAVASHTGRAERSSPAAPADAHLPAERRQSSGV